MSQRNGEKARANVAKKNRNKQRVKDRAKLAKFREGAKEAPKAAKA